MQRLAGCLVLSLVLGLAAPGTVSARQGEEEAQLTNGTVRLPTRFTDGEGGFPGLPRRLYNHAEQLNGLFGYVFEVDPSTWGGRFELTITSQQDPPNDADLGIYLYNHDLGDGGNAGATTTGEYEVRQPGGEEGFIPPDTHWGIVFMSRGLNVAFAYKAFLPMAVEARDSGFAPADVTVKAGGYVVWENLGQAYHSVTASNGSFDSSPTTNKPLIPGATFTTQFLEVGDFAYFDRYTGATGVVHVVPGPGPGTPAG